MTECKEIGYKPIKGADHKQPTYHYEMQPGDALKMIDGFWQPVKVDAKICKQAEQAFNLHFHHGMTIAAFTVGDDTYGQPIPGDGKAKRAPVEKKAKSVVARLREARAAQAAPAQPAPPKPEAPKKGATPKDKPSKRKGGYGID